MDEKILVMLEDRDLANVRRVNRTWCRGESMALEIAKRPGFLLKCERSFQNVMAHKELVEMENKITMRARWATCGSICLWPCTVPATLIGTIAAVMICNGPLACAIFNWWPCTDEDGMDGPMAGTSVPVLNPWMPVAVYKNRGRRYTLLSADEQKKIQELERRVRGRHYTLLSTAE